MKGHDRERGGRRHSVRPYSQMREGRAEDDPSLQALRRRPVPVGPHGAFEVALVDDAGSQRNNIYEIREVGTRKKLAMTGEEIMSLRGSMYPFHDDPAPRVGGRISYNDGRPGHQDVRATVLEVRPGNGMLVQFDDRADTTFISFAEAGWMDHIRPIADG